jgi:hypothetical protein
LLPHLEWVGINDKDSNNILCEFRPVGNSDAQPYDIDELSSGEKAAIALFLPFIEREVAALSGEQAVQASSNIVPITVLIDEPELHLHALLQLNVLEYMRRLARDGRAQFIFTVHSPSMLDALTKDELFLLTPSSLAADNQLSRLVDSSERLEAVRAMTGSTHMLTRCKPIVFVEGEPDDGARATDERILKILLPEAAHWALIASKGKSQVVKAVTEMRQSELNLPGIPVFGLVDNDQGASELPDFVLPWPVAMMENLLLDEEAIREVASLYPGIVQLGSAKAIRDSLLQLAVDQAGEERRLRLRERLPTETFSADSSDPKLVEASIEDAVRRYRSKLGKIDLAGLQAAVDAEVQAIVDGGEQLERFHGKKLLRAWYDKYFKNSGIGWNPFLIELARHTANGERAARLTNPAVARIKLYFPDGLTPVLERCPASDRRDTLLAQCRQEREWWEQEKPEGGSRETLRRQLVQYARESEADERIKAELIQAAMAIGTP